jgi:hypothetical protein
MTIQHTNKRDGKYSRRSEGNTSIEKEKRNNLT